MKRPKKFFSVLFFVFLMVSCSPLAEKNNFQKGKVIIAGKLIAKNRNNAFIFLKNGSFLEDLNKISFCDTSGKFKFEFQIINPQSVLLDYYSKNYELFVKPNDSLFVTINAENPGNKGPVMKIKGATANISYDLQNFGCFKVKHTLKTVPDSLHVPIKKFNKELAKLLRRNDSLIDVFAKQFHPSKKALEFLRYDDKYAVANSLFNNYEGNLPKKGEFDLKMFPIDEDQAIYSSNYQEYLFHMTWRFLSDNPLIRKIYRRNPGEAFNYGLKNILKNEKPGLSRDFMCYQVLDILSQNSWRGFDSLMHSSQTYKGDKVLYGILQQKLKDHQNQEGPGILLFSKKEQKIKGNLYQDLIHRYHGEVIYVDFWEVICPPCLAQIPYEIKLHEFLKGKPVALVSVCLNSSKEEWLKRVKEMHIPGDAYLLSKKESGITVNDFKITHGFPHFIIIDKTGRLVNGNAPEPSSRKIKSVLTSYLNE